MNIFKLMIKCQLQMFCLSLCFSACVFHRSEDEQLQGFLIKQKQIKTLHDEKKIWLSELNFQEPEVKNLLTAIGNRDWQKAITLAKLFLQKKPYHRAGLLIMATAHAGLGEHDRAAYYAELVIKQEPNNSEALNLMGLRYYANAEVLDDYRKALAYFKKAFEKSSLAVAAGLNLGYLLLEIGDAKEAEKIFLQASKRCHLCEDVALGYAIALSRQGQFKLAKSHLMQLVKRNPKNMTAWYQLALYARNIEQDFQLSSQYLKNIFEGEGIQDAELIEKARLLWYENENVKL